MRRTACCFLLAVLSITSNTRGDAQADFDRLFGTRLKNVKTSRETDDDVALADALLDIAKKSTDNIDMLTVLCENVYALSHQHPEGHIKADHALILLVVFVPAKRAEATELRAALLNRIAIRGSKKERATAGPALVKLRLAAGDEYATRNQWAQAINQYRKASIAARRFDPDAVDIANAKIKAISDRRTLLLRVSILEERLLKDASDSQAVEELVEIYLVDLDKPAKVKPLGSRLTNNTLKIVANHAGTPPSRLDEATNLTLAEWYSIKRAKRPATTQAKLIDRSLAHYRQYLKTHTTPDLARKTAETLYQRLTDLRELMAKEALLGAPLIRNSVGMTFVKIKRGRFMMGHHNSAKQTTILKDFHFATTEVTQAQWQAVMETTPWKLKSNVTENDKHPATWISWKDAKAFCVKLSRKETKFYRLPTEAEWEYACRAGSDTAWHFGDNRQDLDQNAWTRETSATKNPRSPFKTALKKPSKWGLYDIHGNVFEWCEEEFQPGRRVVRGGAYSFEASPWSQSHYRASHVTNDSAYYIGFRVVLENK